MTIALLLWFLVNLDFVAFVAWRAGYTRSGFESSPENAGHETTEY